MYWGHGLLVVLAQSSTQPQVWLLSVVKCMRRGSGWGCNEGISPWRWQQLGPKAGDGFAHGPSDVAVRAAARV